MLATKIFDGASAENELERKFMTEGLSGFSHFSYDPYDDSIELHGCLPGMTLPEEIQDWLWEQGFLRCWLNHTDNMETYYCSKIDLAHTIKNGYKFRKDN